MIEYKTGDIFQTTCTTIVNTVNCEGVMGRGIALECKQRYPFMFKVYQYACKYSQVNRGHDKDYYPLNEGGDLYFWFNPKMNSNTLWDGMQHQLDDLTGLGLYSGVDSKCILNFATKEFWRNPSKLEWIERGLYNFCVRTYDDNGRKYYNFGPNTWTEAMSNIAFPKLGCSNGGLNWDDVRPLMEKYLEPLPIKCEIYV